MKTDGRIASRLAELIELGDRVLATRRPPPSNVIGDARVDQQLASQWAASGEAVLARVFGADGAHCVAFRKQVEHHIGYSDAFRAQGVLKAAIDDFAGGHLFELRALIEAEVFDDFLEQAEHLHALGYHPAAAVIAGCVLEDSLRRLSERHEVALPDKPKLDLMNAELAKVGAYSKLVQKRVTALAHIRNQAAHGEWTEFSAADVRDMIEAVRQLVEEHVG